MNKTQEISQIVLKAVALAMGVVVVVLSILGNATVETVITLLGIGLFTLALASLSDTGN